MTALRPSRAPAAAARPALAPLLLLSLAGCLAGPEDRQPVLDVPAAWKDAGTVGTEWPESGWLRAFAPPDLDSMVLVRGTIRESVCQLLYTTMVTPTIKKL